MENQEYEKLLKLLLEKVDKCESVILTKDYRIKSLEAEIERLRRKSELPAFMNKMETR